MKVQFRGKIIDGKPKLYNPELFEVYLGTFKENQEIVYRLVRYSKGRTNPQNSYMWGVVYMMISNELGYTPEEVHDLMRMEHLVDRTGKFPRLRSTTELSRVEMEEYLTKVRNWASAELGLYIPLPNEEACPVY